MSHVPTHYVTHFAFGLLHPREVLQRRPRLSALARSHTRVWKLHLLTCAFVLWALWSATKPATADQWGPVVQHNCYAEAGEHTGLFTVRFFYAELNKVGRFIQTQPESNLKRLGQLSEAPISCSLGGNIVKLEIFDYKPPRETGACARCEWGGVRVSTDDKLIWEQASPDGYESSMFMGTIDIYGSAPIGGVIKVCPEWQLGENRNPPCDLIAY